MPNEVRTAWVVEPLFWDADMLVSRGSRDIREERPLTGYRMSVRSFEGCSTGYRQTRSRCRLDHLHEYGSKSIGRGIV